MEKNIEPLLEENDDDSEFIGILVAVFIIIITLVLITFWSKKRSAGRSVLLTGLSDSGKTLIFTRLNSKFAETYTSVKENVGDIPINNNFLRIVDIPGDERLRNKYFDKYKSFAKGLVYVIDSVLIQTQIKDVAEYLYNLLSDPDIQRNVPILILCNKQDQTMAKGCSVIKTLLEREMNLLRMTKTSQLEATDASSANVFLGKQGKDFEFLHLDSQIDFAESYAFNKDPQTPVDIEELKKWLHKIA